MRADDFHALCRALFTSKIVYVRCMICIIAKSNYKCNLRMPGFSFVGLVPRVAFTTRANFGRMAGERLPFIIALEAPTRRRISFFRLHFDSRGPK